MSLILVLALQTAVATPAASAPPPARPRWAMPVLIATDGGAQGNPLDFARFAPAGGARFCLPAAGTDVLVCGPRRGGAAGAYPIAMWDRIFAPRPIRAEMNLGPNAQGRIYNEAVPMDRGAVSNRVMIGLRTRF